MRSFPPGTKCNDRLNPLFPLDGVLVTAALVLALIHFRFRIN